MRNTDLTLPAGTLVVLDCIAKLEHAGTVVNLTGKTLRFTAKRKSTDADAVAVITKSSPSSGIAITGASAGEFTVTLDAADTDQYNNYERAELVYDIMIVEGPYRLVMGKLILSGSVTHVP